MNVDEALATVRVMGRPPAFGEVSMAVAQTLADEVKRLRVIEARAQDAAAITGPKNEWWSGWRAAAAHILRGIN